LREGFGEAQVSNGTLWHEFCWIGALGDATLIAAGISVAAYFMYPKMFQVSRILLLSAYSAVFVWLNIEGWFYGVPGVLMEFPNNIDDGMQQMQTATLGFPLVYWHFDSERRLWPLVANILIGLAGWLLLLGLLQWKETIAAQRTSVRRIR
jgi:hypothetical protein